MRALVVYESMYGNTAAVGEAIATSLRAHGFDAAARPVSEIDPAETAGTDLLVVGGPTHVHGMSRASTRKAAVEDEKNTFTRPTLEPGLREWIERLPAGKGRFAAAFDTRLDKPAIFTGSAAKTIGRRLERRDFRLAVEPESYFVSTENRLLDGQLAHGAAWAVELAAQVTEIASASPRERRQPVSTR